MENGKNQEKLIVLLRALRETYYAMAQDACAANQPYEVHDYVKKAIECDSRLHRMQLLFSAR